jgi:hypothetical protein
MRIVGGFLSVALSPRRFAPRLADDGPSERLIAASRPGNRKSSRGDRVLEGFAKSTAQSAGSLRACARCGLVGDYREAASLRRMGQCPADLYAIVGSAYGRSAAYENPKKSPAGLCRVARLRLRFPA